MTTTLPLQFGLPGGPELLIILFIAVLLFGANKLPALARSSGQAIGEFKRGRQELEDELKRGVQGGRESEERAGVSTTGAETESSPEIETTEPKDTEVAS